MIRPYRHEDAVHLTGIHTAVFPDNPLSIASFGNYVSSILACGGRAWVSTMDAPIGYALAVPVPGLPHVGDLKGCIVPEWQRQGFGSRLLRQVLSDLLPTSLRLITHQVRSLASPAAQFLLKNGFDIEHEEWLMIRSDLHDLPRPDDKDGTTVVTLSRIEAVRHFHHLFGASFAGHPWDQPYSVKEIETALDNAQDILFLRVGSMLIGFAWLHLQTGGLGMIEPLGVLPEYQQQGYGRFLLQSALQELALRGASRVQIGAWGTNQSAIRLYKSLGLEQQETITFLAYDVAK